MKVLTLDVWQGIEAINDFVEKGSTGEYDRCIYFSQKNWNYWNIPRFNEIVADVKNLTIVASTDLYINTEPSIPDNVTKQIWNTWYVHHTIDNVSVKSVDAALKYPYVSLNNNTHPWRCMMFDMLAEYNILHKGAVSWNKMPEKNQYKFQFTKPRIMKLTDFYKADGDYSSYPVEWYESAIQLVSENHVRAGILTEKTVMPLIYGKPFIVFGTPYFYKFLKSLGIQLYDELFDYSFDEILDDKSRCQKVIENVARVCEMNDKDLFDISVRLHNKLVYNQQRIKEISYDYSLYPEAAKLVVDLYESSGVQLDKSICYFYARLKNHKHA